MHVTEKLTRPLTEAKYLNADNADRYRSIMRIFYENYEKLRYWMYQEEVYAEMTADPYFADYRMEQCQQDLAMLTEWKNLNTIQDTRLQIASQNGHLCHIRRPPCDLNGGHPRTH